MNITEIVIKKLDKQREDLVKQFNESLVMNETTVTILLVIMGLGLYELGRFWGRREVKLEVEGALRYVMAMGC